MSDILSTESARTDRVINHVKDAVDADVRGLRALVNDLLSKYNDLLERVCNNENQLDLYEEQIQDQLDSHDSRLENVEGDLTTAQDDIEDLLTDVQDLHHLAEASKTIRDALEERVVALEQETKDLDETVAERV